MKYEYTDLMHLVYVPRWAIVPMARTQSVAEHSFRVAAIAGEIAKRAGLETEEALYAAALWHDVSECFTGDLPSTVPDKPAVGAAPYQDLDKKLENILKIADIMEALSWYRKWGKGGFKVEREIEGRLKRYLQWPAAAGYPLDTIVDQMLDEMETR